MPIDLSTKNQRTHEASDGSSWTFRPLTSWEKAAWSTQQMGAPSSPDAAVAVWRNPIAWATVSWDRLRDEDGHDVPFPRARSGVAAALERVSPNTLIEVSFAILAASGLTEDDRGKSSSAPSPTPES